MCLSSINATQDKPSDLIVGGWKEFSGKAPSLTFWNFGGAVVMDSWLKAEEIKIPAKIAASDGNKYQAGFHIYPDEKDAKTHLHFRRVYYRRVTCTGSQNGKRCVIAQEMYVPSDPDAWPPQSPAATPAPKKKLIDRLKRVQ